MTIQLLVLQQAQRLREVQNYFWLKHDQGIPEPQRPLPPGKTEHADDRGTRIHQSVEDYVAGRSMSSARAERFFGPRSTFSARCTKKVWSPSKGNGVCHLAGTSGTGLVILGQRQRGWGLPIEKVSALPYEEASAKAYSRAKDHHLGAMAAPEDKCVGHARRRQPRLSTTKNQAQVR